MNLQNPAPVDILVVEDESNIRRLICGMLEQSQFSVLETGLAHRAIGLLDSHPEIRLAIIDMVMPGMSGGQLAELLAGKYSAMKVLFVSGYSEKVVLRHKILDVQTNFLQKPFTLKALAMKIREVLGHVSVSASAGGS